MARIHRRTVIKDFNDPDSHEDVITLLEPDILECEVKWALGSPITNKASRGDGIPAELFQILKDDIALNMSALNCWHSTHQQIWKLSNGHRTGKGQFSFQSQRRAMPKNVQTTIQLCSFPMLVRICSKSFKLGFSSMSIKNFHMYKLGLEKAEEEEIKLVAFAGS